jgi:hypothetical protein
VIREKVQVQELIYDFIKEDGLNETLETTQETVEQAVHFDIALEMLNFGEVQWPAYAHHVVEGKDTDTLEAEEDEDNIRVKVHKHVDVILILLEFISENVYQQLCNFNYEYEHQQHHH